ncbi:hypothetical protein MKX33_00740 [Paenibacillus sp. FSL R5-0490]|uniref:hypothetical protein n=1 Tax=Paenibacillus sp. FSL R5-0490 TaxID=1920424 RepID=UPI0030CF4CEA
MSKQEEIKQALELLHKGGAVPLNVVEAVNDLLEELKEYGTLIEQQGKEMIRLQQLANKQGKELEEARKATLIEVRDKLHGKILLLTVEMDYAEPDEWKLLNIKYEAWAEEWKYLTGLIGDGQEGEGNQ